MFSSLKKMLLGVIRHRPQTEILPYKIAAIGRGNLIYCREESDNDDLATAVDKGGINFWKFGTMMVLPF